MSGQSSNLGPNPHADWSYFLLTLHSVAVPSGFSDNCQDHQWPAGCKKDQKEGWCLISLNPYSSETHHIFPCPITMVACFPPGRDANPLCQYLMLPVTPNKEANRKLQYFTNAPFTDIQWERKCGHSLCMTSLTSFEPSMKLSLHPRICFLYKDDNPM